MKINHVALFTDQLEEMRLFYVTYFNGKSNQLYQNKSKGFSSYFISFEENTRLELMSRNDVKEKYTVQDHLGYIHLAFSAGSKEKVDELTLRLEKDGYTVISGPRVTGDGYYESCILDPDGNQVEIVV
jgi:lactoylglutathione lyase